MRKFIKREPAQSSSWVTASCLFAGLLTLNAFLVSPYIGWYDSGEMIGTTLCLGISHPSGQVLFHLLGKVFLLLPFGTPAYRLGLMSAACSAAAAVLFFLLAGKLVTAFRNNGGEKTPSVRLRVWIILLTLGWALSLPWWRYSLMPLVYALHLLLGMMVLWALSLSKPAKWPLVFFIVGIATVFRPTQFFVLPFVGLAYFIHLQRPKAKTPRKNIVVRFFNGLKDPFVPLSLIAFILGRSTALYLPLRSALRPELAYADLTSPGAFVNHLFALRFSKFVGTVTISTINSIFTSMLSHLWNDLTALGLGLLIFGLLLLIRGHRKVPLFLWVGMGWGAVETLFVYTIPFPTFESHQVLLSWVYFGFCAVLPLVYFEEWSRKDGKRVAAVGVAMALFVLGQSFFMGHLLERKKERGAQDYAKNILGLMEPGSVYIPTEENEYFPVVGYQQSFHYQNSVDVIEPGTTPDVVGKKIQDCLTRGSSLYVSRKWTLPYGWRFEGVGPLLKVVQGKAGEEVKHAAATAPPAASWGGIRLAGASITPGKVAAGGRIEIHYRWSRKGPSECDQTDSIVALFADDEGNYLMKSDVFWLHDIHEGPQGRLSLMKPGYEYEEKRILFIPSDFPPGRYRLVVGLQKPVPERMEARETYGREFYERSGFQNLGKFMGRGENNSVVQFSAAMANPVEMSLWLPEQKGKALSNSRFVPVADLEITPADESK